MNTETPHNETESMGAASELSAGLERDLLRSKLIELAAQMAKRQRMPSPDDWPGWGGTPQKLWRAARADCEKASDQCADWAYEVRKIADAL